METKLDQLGMLSREVSRANTGTDSGCQGDPRKKMDGLGEQQQPGNRTKIPKVPTMAAKPDQAQLEREEETHPPPPTPPWYRGDSEGQALFLSRWRTCRWEPFVLMPVAFTPATHPLTFTLQERWHHHSPFSTKRGKKGKAFQRKVLTARGKNRDGPENRTQGPSLRTTWRTWCLTLLLDLFLTVERRGQGGGWAGLCVCVRREVTVSCCHGWGQGGGGGSQGNSNCEAKDRVSGFRNRNNKGGETKAETPDAAPATEKRKGAGTPASCRPDGIRGEARPVAPARLQPLSPADARVPAPRPGTGGAAGVLQGGTRPRLPARANSIRALRDPPGSRETPPPNPGHRTGRFDPEISPNPLAVLSLVPEIFFPEGGEFQSEPGRCGS
ncbi:uncharacterized protein LOC125095519 [Lutra lutra]|uniref:uncharacterized protein LOC125095519 n=1 Tax=Lutra lutra TaxID=9657 RepID=UPI001FCF9244|nr:uncharacterized protein LOC125095519 [Lutra lutra]